VNNFQDFKNALDLGMNFLGERAGTACSDHNAVSLSLAKDKILSALEDIRNFIGEIENCGGMHKNWEPFILAYDKMKDGTSLGRVQ
jgi:hypothetical protein